MTHMAILILLALLSLAGAPPARAAETLIVAGDQHACNNSGIGAEATASIVDTIPGTVIAIGDMATEWGTADEYECYTPTWGRFMDRTLAVVGNHDYGNGTNDGQAFRDYFATNLGPSAHPTYYSTERGAWRIYILDSNCEAQAPHVDCSDQENWLRRNLENNPTRCVAAFFHHPRWSSMQGDGVDPAKRFFTILYRAGADLVVSAHRHAYERFTNMGPGGPDTAGPRAFVVGTGGTSRWHEQKTTPAGSQQLIQDTWGVLDLTLRWDSYDWSFIGTDGSSLDAGTDTCSRPAAIASRKRR